ncbi:GatB/YqeY domain-containing protein [Angustibacter sp. Root456]|uniref:GatB/YqeY domain-containing protein n=1 Tax=Angustibacter sp. Root456 TaxID=1736539 RepID=UPI0006F78A46|nr:GatB/YqeY domain-containing protein [Angustibacter sp. Root456]KQX61668.1 glutamyl-tRNA amidotransferase [Angustibacter sp. Root456]
MSTLKQTLRDDLTTAIREQDEVRVATLRMVLTAITNEEVAGDVARELSDDDVQAVLRREAKKRREAATAFADGGRPERADRERAEMAVIEGYLPAQLDDAALAELVSAAIRDTGAEGMKAMGQVMKAASAAVAGRAEGGRVAAEVRRQLAQ